VIQQIDDKTYKHVFNLQGMDIYDSDNTSDIMLAFDFMGKIFNNSISDIILSTLSSF